MTNAQQTELWLKFHRFQLRYENKFVPKINSALKDQINTYARFRDTIYVRSGGLYTTLVDLYKTTGKAWAYNTRGDIANKAGGQMGFSERIVTFMQRYFTTDLLAVAENITQTTIRLIGEVLAEAALEGWSFDEIVSKLQSPEFTAERARLIARTETVNAAAIGAMINAKSAGADRKIWIAARDNRTREHHREVNQTIVGIDEKFQVGEYLMDHPGDKEGGPEEVCNCRCVLGFMMPEVKALTKEDVAEQQKKEILPMFDTVSASMDELEISVSRSIDDTRKSIAASNSQAVSTFTESLEKAIAGIPAPVVNVEAPIVHIPEPVVNVAPPIIEVTEQKVDQGEVIDRINIGVTEITQVGREVVQGQKKIVSLLEESLKPKPKKKWEFTTVIENGRIKKVIAQQIN